MLSSKEQEILALLRDPANEAARNRCIERWFYKLGPQSFRAKIESIVRNYVNGSADRFQSICDDVSGRVVEQLMNPNLTITSTLPGYIHRIVVNLFVNATTRGRILGKDRLNPISIDTLIQIEDKEEKRPNALTPSVREADPRRPQRVVKDNAWTDPLLQASIPKLSEKDQELLRERYLVHENKHGCVRKMEQKYGQNLDARFERILVRIAEASIGECKESLQRLWAKYGDSFPEEERRLVALFFQGKSQEEICQTLGRKKNWKCFERVAEIHARCVSREKTEYNEWKQESRELRRAVKEQERAACAEPVPRPAGKPDAGEVARRRSLDLLRSFGDSLPEAERTLLRSFLEERTPLETLAASVPGGDAAEALSKAFGHLVRQATDACNARISAVRDDRNRIRQVLWKFSARKDWDISFIAPAEMAQIGQRCLPLVDEFVSAARNKMTPALRLFFQNRPMREISEVCGQPDMTSLATLMLTDFNAICDKASSLFRTWLGDFTQAQKDFPSLLAAKNPSKQN